MGRELKRVPLDFNWPLGAIWGGYRNPYNVHCANCDKCETTGLSEYSLDLHKRWYGKVPFQPEQTGSVPFTKDHPVIVQVAQAHVKYSGVHPSAYSKLKSPAVEREAHRLADLFNRGWNHHLDAADVKALWEAGRLGDFQRDGRTEPPDPQEVNLWSIVGLGHDAINAHICIEARALRDGHRNECTKCAGSGSIWDDPKNHELAENWEKTHPPVGDGFQLWTTTNEGAPISPVFANLKDLCEWCAEKATTFAHFKATAQEWEAMLGSGMVAHREGNTVFI